VWALTLQGSTGAGRKKVSKNRVKLWHGYNGRFGNATAFYFEVFLISGFYLKGGVSKSQDSQCFQCPYRPELSQHCSTFLASTSCNGAHSWLTQLSPLDGLAGGNRISAGLLASRLLLYLSSREKYPARTFMNIDRTKIAVGKYLVSPLAKQQAEGRYAASVSIRSGQGSATHDRVLRFSGLFDSAAAAVHYATEHALGWIHERSSRACA
jgi:hypothetical protein